MSTWDKVKLGLAAGIPRLITGGLLGWGFFVFLGPVSVVAVGLAVAMPWTGDAFSMAGRWVANHVPYFSKYATPMLAKIAGAQTWWGQAAKFFAVIGTATISTERFSRFHLPFLQSAVHAVGGWAPIVGGAVNGVLFTLLPKADALSTNGLQRALDWLNRSQSPVLKHVDCSQLAANHQKQIVGRSRAIRSRGMFAALRQAASHQPGISEVQNSVVGQDQPATSLPSRQSNMSGHAVSTEFHAAAYQPKSGVPSHGGVGL